VSLPDLLRRLGVQLPICQAPIGSLASPELAAAVAEAGAVGHVACTWRTPDELSALFRRIHALTGRAFGANFVLDFPIESRLAVALEHGVPIISFFWGDGARHLSRVRAAGAVAIQVVGSVDEARRAADAGLDLVVAQGREAGGHVRGERGTMTLVPEVVDAVAPLPVIAAGGIADRRGVAAAFALGASGVWVGTRFAAARAANIHPIYRELLVTADGADTVHSTLFDIGWPEAPMRTLRNSTVRAWEAAGRPAAPGRPNEGEQIARRGDSAVPRYHFAAPTREAAGDVEAMALYAGEGTGLVRAIEPASAIVADLAAGIPETFVARASGVRK
jgi:nitronate monooxygenase